MAKVSDLDIPPGLEEPYFKIVQFASASSQDRIVLRRSSPARNRFYTVGDRSLFVLWAPLYNSLSTDRHDAWTAYWESLPFGDHSGLSGWPGSGFSAFVYANAPRYEAGLDPLLDPPAANLIYNGSFNGNANGWDINNGAYVDHDVETTDQDFQMFQQDWPNPQFLLVPGGTYRLSATAHTDLATGFVGLIYSDALNTYDPDTGGIVFEDIFLNDSTPYNDFVVPVGATNGALYLAVSDAPESTWSITNISLVRIA